MKNKTTLARRIISTALSVAIVLPMCLAVLPSSAQARVSLPNVEHLKQQGGAFKILEILPNAAQGSIGYYIGGQEPCASWAQQAGKKENADTPNKRKDFVNSTLFSNLKKAGLLGEVGAGATQNPLTLSESYSEAYPWETHNQEFKELTLEYEETEEVSGTITPAPDGAYVDSGVYELEKNGSGTHVQIVDYFTTTPTGEVTNYYWYEPTFTLIDKDDSVSVGTAVYENNGGTYVYIGTVGNSNFNGMEIGKEYYSVTVTNEPAQTKDEKHIYAAVSGGFRPIATGEVGYFSQKENKYTYVGSGGDYNFSEGTDEFTLATKTVFYKGGFKNNDWFYRCVMDWEPEQDEEKPKINIIVETVSAKDVTTDQVNGADMLILSGGYVPNGTAESYSTGNDIAANADGSVYKRIIDLCKPTTADAEPRPVIVDKELTAGTLNINRLALVLTDGKTDAHVSKNVYCAAYPIAGVDFNKSFPESKYKTNGTPFYEVFRQIEYENFLRGESSEKLPVNVSSASCIRHIIAGTRVTNAKNTIKVLDIEPGKSSSLSKSSVQTWLGDSSVEVSITTMSTSELIGKIEDIAETYDLVYIGSNIGDFNTKTEYGEVITDYFDNDMDGLVYSNIGDNAIAGGQGKGIGSWISKSNGWSMSGLLDRDYDTAKKFNENGEVNNANGRYATINANDISRTFRYSGNDLTEKKMQELLDYANEGHPVILANSLSAKLSVEKTQPDGKPWDSMTGYCKWGATGIFDCAYDAITVPDTNRSSLSAYLTKKGLFEVSEVSKANVEWFRYVDGGSKDILVKEEKNVIIFYGKAVSELSISEIPGMSEKEFKNGYFYCKVYAATITNNFNNAWNVTPAQSKLASVALGVNCDRVDNCSKMYELLQELNGKPNVKNEWQLASNIQNQQYMRDCVNLSKPDIEFLKDSKGKPLYPNTYTKAEDGTATSLSPKQDGSYALEYAFKIKRETDPTPLQTRYTGKLYIDTNGDGSYTDNEQLTDIIVRKYTSSTGAVGERVDPTKLEINTEYILTRKLPSDKIGIIPWKLDIEKTGSAAVRNSAHGYTHIKPDANQIETIDVLQINTKGNFESGLSLETSPRFKDLFDSVSGEFKINVMTVGAAELDTLLTDYQKYLNDSTKKAEGNDSEALITYLRTKKNAGIEFNNLKELLASIDMLIMGFDDCYHGISLASANAIVEFIDSGKATLFSHDNTSFFFLPLDYYGLNSGTHRVSDGLFKGHLEYDYVYSTFDWLAPNPVSFGYNFNMTIRDKVGLDRYGVTNSTYGLSKHSHPDSAASGIVASGEYLSLNLQKRLELVNAGYDIAYKPKSALRDTNGNLTSFKTVAETQGLTKGVIVRYYNSGGLPTNGAYKGTAWYETNYFETLNTITQVNEGQITTYPFNVNTDWFKSYLAEESLNNKSNKLSIATTHFQYQQLNMNAADVVVWYCLSGGTMDYTPNDVVNSYYIYSRGNVTYTGFGHTTNPTDAEAKLLVNTIVAAYRTAQTAPVIRFTNENGTVDMDSFLMPSDSGEVIKLTASNDKNRRIFFTVYDTNIGEQKKITAEFSCNDGETVTKLDKLPVHDAQNNKIMNENEKQSLVSGVTYYVNLDDILSIVDKNENYAKIIDNLQITAKVSCERNGQTSSGEDTLTLRKLNLFDLS